METGECQNCGDDRPLRTVQIGDTEHDVCPYCQTRYMATGQMPQRGASRLVQ